MRNRDNRSQGSSIKPEAVSQVVAWLATVRLDGAAEKRAQKLLAEALDNAGITYEREKRLSNEDIRLSPYLVLTSEQRSG